MGRLDDSAESSEGVFTARPDRVAALLDLGTSGEGDLSSAEGSPGATSAHDDGPPEVPGYEITGRLGEGGMGTVWRAVQLSTRREVALKLVAHAAVGSHRARLRFDREVELAARLEHPHIARVYDSGMYRGLFYYAMELVEGRHLDVYAREERLDRGQTLSLMHDVCLAVQHAHQKGVIHRDLKPSNVLVTKEGVPKVLDFGLARALDDDGGGLTLTMEGQWAGTPAFMSPEQAAGDSRRIDTRTDVWGLGATLYLLLTGRPAHDTSGPRHVVMRRVVEEEVRRPQSVDKSVGGELEAVLLKALGREPDRRYDSAGALARDLENYLTGRPVAARRPSAAYVLRKWVGRHRARAMIVVLAAGLALAAGLYHQRQMARQRQRSEHAALVLRAADWMAARGQFNAALLKYDWVMHGGHEDCRAWRDHACLHLALGNWDEYRAICRRLVERFGDTREPDVAEAVAKACLLCPDAVDDLGPVSKLVERLLAAPSNSSEQGWRYLAKGMAEYRAGRVAQCLPWLERVEHATWDTECRAYARSFAAMAYQRLGNAPRALESLQSVSAPAGPDLGMRWSDHLALLVIEREVEAIVGARRPKPLWSAQLRVGPIPLPGRIEAEDFNKGGEATTDDDWASGVPAGASKTSGGSIGIGTCRDHGGGQCIGGARAGAWLAYTVEVKNGGAYDFEARVASIWAGGQFHIECAGRDVTGPIDVPQTGDWQVYTTVQRRAITLHPGRQEIRVVFDRNGTGGAAVCNLNWFEFRRSGDAPPD